MKVKFMNIFRISRIIYQNSQLSAILSTLCYVVEGVLPGVFTYYLIKIIDSFKFAGTAVSDNSYISYIIILGAVYLIQSVFEIINSVTLNAGIFETSNLKLKNSIALKASRLKLISFENPEMLNLKKKAESCVQDEIIGMGFFMVLKSFSSLLSMLSITVVLFQYHWVLAFLTFLSIIPVLITRFLRGMDFANLKNEHLPHERKLNYLWRLFTGKK